VEGQYCNVFHVIPHALDESCACLVLFINLLICLPAYLPNFCVDHTAIPVIEEAWNKWDGGLHRLVVLSHPCYSILVLKLWVSYCKTRASSIWTSGQTKTWPRFFHHLWQPSTDLGEALSAQIWWYIIPCTFWPSASRFRPKRYKTPCN
jgi:hypothetical protein